ncbi:MAG: 1-deoxy-D-xylulose-5-phosphate reductoisomerase [Candidatus Caldatribacteriota bacterium]|nr:1-deoxy-D-xylulose-5-phosphate reductoisomerase [Candidatus Caldatribacteriota bacterium]
MKKKIVILGSTGSIGKQALKVISDNQKEFDLIGLSGWENVELLNKQILKYKPKIAVVKDEYLAKKVKNNTKNKFSVKIMWGIRGLIELATMEETDLLVIAITGIASLIPTYEAIKKNKNIALASKEAMVVAGEILTNEAKLHNINIIPIDSEHNAIFQCIKNEKKENIEKIILTASGGSLYNLTESTLKDVTVEEALNHPNWKMGKKITIDSATLMNKGLEVIEARWFFNMPLDKIEVVIHPQSYIHSMVQFIDGTIQAQISEHDMKLPIQYAMTYPERIKNNYPVIDLVKIKQLTFKSPNYKKFPCIKLAYKAIEIGGTMPAVLNAANEIAVSAFLNKRIKIVEISNIIQTIMKNHKVKMNPVIADIFDADYWARQESLSIIMNK